MPRVLKYKLSEERKEVRAKIFDIKSDFKQKYPYIKCINKTIIDYVGGQIEYLSPSKKVRKEYFVDLLEKLNKIKITDLYKKLIK